MWRLLLLLFLLFGGCAKREFHLRVLHINDTHSHIDPTTYKLPGLGMVRLGGYGAIAAHVATIRRHAPHTLFLHGGDALQGSLYSQLFHGRADALALNLLGLDAMTLGNHEFDRGLETLIAWMAQIHFPLLGANLPLARAYVLVPFGQEVVAVVGVSPEKIGRIYPATQDPISRLAQVLKELESLGIDKIVVLSHLGLWWDRQLARSFPQIDLIVGGHSHTLLGDFTPLGLISQGPYPIRIGSTLIVHAWKWGMVVGDIELLFDEAGVVTSFTPRPKLLVHDQELARRFPAYLAFAKPSREFQEAMAPYRNVVEKLRNQIVGKAAIDLWHVRLPCQQAPDGSLLPQGSLVAPHVAQAMAERTRADVAIINAGGVRRSLFAGPVSMADVMELLPFEDRIVVMQMRGKELEALLQERIQRALQGGGGAFPYVAGVKIVIGKEHIATNLQPEGTYRVATSAFLARGGAGYRFKGRIVDEMGSIQEAFIAYLQAHRSLGAPGPWIEAVCPNGAPR
ncbi:MAG: hypothetical protein C6I00_07245 [Nitratiruptor sp.]|nr:hypothetical protein [Nitratiruptor sp.]NPA83830.1 bifunctional metallophosphatase/5'-nucleotidase [Campylobacterota bacterium]